MSLVTAVGAGPPGRFDTAGDTSDAVLTLSSGPLWRLIVDAGADLWLAEVSATAPVRRLTLAADDDGLMVTGEPVGSPVAAAWVLTQAVCLFVRADRAAFAGVPLRIAVGSLTVAVPGDVLAGVAGGKGRRWWARRSDHRLG